MSSICRSMLIVIIPGKTLCWRRNLKSNTFQHGLRNISLSTGLDNGEEEENYENIFFTAVWNGVQITCGTEYRHAIRRVSIIQPSLFYFSLRIS